MKTISILLILLSVGCGKHSYSSGSSSHYAHDPATTYTHEPTHDTMRIEATGDDIEDFNKLAEQAKEVCHQYRGFPVITYAETTSPTKEGKRLYSIMFTCRGQ